MLKNRSVPSATVIPELAYPDVGEAVDWLCDVFGFIERLRIGNHRAQLLVGEGAVILTQQRIPDAPEEFASPDASKGPTRSDMSHSLLVRIDDVDGHHAHASQRGARILHPPTDYPYGERQYVVEDLGGHRWTFSQTVADVDPATWGGTLK